MRSVNDLPHAWVDVTQNALASAGKSSPQSGLNQYQFGLINIFLMLCQVRRDFAGWLCKISPSIIIKIFAQRSTQKNILNGCVAQSAHPHHKNDIAS